MTEQRPAHLAWHETLEMHELVVLQSVTLMKLKLFSESVQDNVLKQLYIQTIQDLEQNLNDLLGFYPKAAREKKVNEAPPLDDAFFASDLLAFSKTLIKCYAAAITETATNSLSDTFVQHLNKAIKCHTKIFNFMNQKGLYPAYHLEQLLEGDIQLAQNALME